MNSRRSISLVLFPACLALGVAARAQTVSWIGAAGTDWANALNWSPTLIPSLGNTAVINSGAVTVGDARSVGALSFLGGTLSGAGTLTLTSTGSVWDAGSMTFTGGGGVTQAAGGTWTISTTADHDFNGTALVNNGTVQWTVGNLRTGNGGSFTNNLTFNDSASGTTSVQFNNDYGGAATFTNSLGATYTKSASGTTTYSGVAFNNSGTVAVTAGTLSLNGGGTTASTGTFAVSPGAGFNISGGTYTFANGASVTGTGTFSVSAGTLSVAAGSANLSNLTVNGGNLAGAGTAAIGTLLGTSGTISISSFTLSGASTWSGGTWNSSAASTAAVGSGATLTISSAADHDFNLRNVTNNGTVQWTGGNLRTGNGGSFTNNLTFNDSASGTTSVRFNNDYGGAATFTNSLGATYTKSATGTTTFSGVEFNNSGTVAVTAGTLSLNGGGTTASTGTFAVSPGAGFNISGGTYTFANGASVTGTGTFSVSAGTLSVATGSANFSNLTVNGGTLAGAGTAAIGTLLETSGTISISSFTLSGASTWSGGTWNSGAPAVTTIASGAALSLSNSSDPYRDFNFRSITNNGTVNWSSAYLRGGNGSVFTNTAGAVFNDYNAAGYTIHNPHGGSFSFVNNGTYNRDATNTTYFDVPFDNNGAINLVRGDLQFRNGGTFGSAGTIVAAAGTNVYFTTSYTVTNGASLTGAGTYWLTNGTLNAGGTLTVSTFNQTGGNLAGTNALNGVFNWSGGNWNAGATGPTTALQSGATLNLRDSNDPYRDFNFRSITNNGTVNWYSAYIRGGNGSVFLNAAGAVFNDFNAPGYTINNPHGGSFTFVNNGTYNRDATNTTYFDTTFDNNGVINLLRGDIHFRSGGTLGATGTVVTATGTNVYFTNSYTITNGASLTGAGTYWLTNGTLTAGGTLSVSTLNQTGGNLTGTNALNGIVNWSGGNWNTGAIGPATTIQAGATLNLTHSNDPYRDFNFRSITNNGTVNWHSAYIRGGNGSVFTNAAGAVFNDYNAPSYTINNPHGGSFTFVNNGTYNRNATGTTYFDTTFDNNGTINLLQGDIQFRSGGTLGTGGSINASAGTNIYFTNNYSIANASAMTGAGTYWLTGGTLTATGAMTVGNFNQTGGTLAGTSTMSGVFTWTGGNWNTGAAGSVTTFASGSTLNLSNTNDPYRDFNFRSITNNGTVNWSAGYLRGGNGSVFTNAAGATFNDFNSPGYTLNNPHGGSFTFVNNGTYTRNTTGTTYFDTTFNNNGSLNLLAGDIQIRSGGTMSATSVVNGASGTRLYFTNNYTLVDGAQFAGAGLFNQTAGTLTLDGSLRASAFLWSGGSWNAAANSGLTTINAAATILNLTNANDPNRDFHGRSVVNNGTINWHTAYLRGGQGSVFTNAAGATFNDFNASSYTINNPWGGTFAFVNNGTYVRNAGGTTFFDTTFNNNAALNLLAGDIQIRSGGTMSASSVVQAAAGTRLYFTNNYTLAHGAQFTGAGLFNQTAGTLIVDGTLQAPAFLWSGGNWNAATNSGLTTTIGAATILNLTNAQDPYRDFHGRSILNQGVVNWQTAYLRGGNGSTFTNAAGATFNDLNASGYSINNPWGASFVFVNNGNYVRNAGGTTYFDTTFNNNGSMSLLQGDIQVRSGGTMSATSVVNAATGTNLYFTNSYTLLDGAQFTGAGTFRQTGGSLVVNGALRASNFTWSGGDWNAVTSSGLITTIAAGTTLNLKDSDSPYRDFHGRGILNQGVVNWNAGYLRGGNGGSFVNAAGGVFNDFNSPGYTIHNPWGGTFAFTNQGTYNKLTTGTTSIQVPFANQGGSILVNAGTLHFTTTFTQTAGTLFLFGNATARFDQDLNFPAGTLGGSGTVVGSVTNGGALTPGNSTGRLNVTGNLTLLATSTLLIELGGPVQGTAYDFLSVGGSGILAGSLSLYFTNGFQGSVQPGDTFTVLTATGLSGTFVNAGNGQRLVTGDGLGSFQVNFGTGSAFAANSLVLSNFVPIPEPSTYILLGAGALAVAATLRRRRR